MAEIDGDLSRRLDDIVELIASIAGGEFHARGPISERRDEVDAVVAGLNLLAEDFGFERTRRNAAEEQLKDAMEAYENAPALFCSVDPRSGVVVQCNNTMARALHRDRSAIIGKPLEALYRPAAREFVRATLDALSAGQHLPSGDHELQCEDGSLLATLLSGSVVEGATGPERLRLVYRDVTEERRLEAQLLQAQKMDGIGRLAGGVAHDFNNLLTVIFGCADMLRPVVKGSPETEDLEQLFGAAQRAAELTNHLLAFSRQTVVAPTATDVNALLLRMEKLLRRTLGEQIAIVTVPEASLWTVLVDAARFEQVVMNLAVNARDAMPGGGHLTLETQNVVLDEEYARLHLGIVPGEYVMLAVSDAGMGMSREVMDRAFEPFFTTKEVGKGTGLGLAMVYGIVRQAGGGVSVYSEPGRGTTFKVYLPRSVEDPGEVSSETALLPRGGSESVLVVEDEVHVRMLVQRTLRGAGYEVVEAADGRSALDTMRRRGKPVDLVLTDVVMPSLGGREMVAQLRADGLCQRALFMSGYTSNSIVHRGVLERDTAFIQKPFTPSALLSRVRELLDARAPATDP